MARHTWGAVHRQAHRGGAPVNFPRCGACSFARRARWGDPRMFAELIMHEARPHGTGTKPAGAGGLMRHATRTAGLAMAITMVTLTAGLAPAAGTGRAPGAFRSLGAHRIQHVIEIMLENHTYANLFPVHGRRRHGRLRTIKAPANEGD